MSVTCGFFNAINHDRTYDARQMSAIFDGIINDGVFMNIGSGMAVKSDPVITLDDMKVYVEPGRCWFNSSWTLNDAILPLQVEESELVLDRIDTVVLEVNHNDAVRACQFKIIKGTPATNPQPAELEDSEYVHQHAFARIYVAAGVTKITQGNITNCIGTSETPYVTGILETINADDLLAQWQGQFVEFLSASMTEYESWKITNDEDLLEWQKHNKDVFDAWLQSVTDILLDSEVLSTLKSVLYTEVEMTLPAGTNELTFENIMLHDGMKIRFFSEVEGMYDKGKEIDWDNHTITAKFYPTQKEDVSIILRIEN